MRVTTHTPSAIYSRRLFKTNNCVFIYRFTFGIKPIQAQQTEKKLKVAMTPFNTFRKI